VRPIEMFCTRCGKSFPADGPHFRCWACNEPIAVELTTKGSIRKGDPLTQSLLERYADFFPFRDVDRRLSLHEGFTPLVESPRLAEALGVKRLYLKNESQNPTWSYKDRGTLVTLQHALKLGYKRFGCVSCGNMAVSVAAYASRAGLRAVIFLKENMPDEKLGPITIYNPLAIKVQGSYAALFEESFKIGQAHGIYFTNGDIPFRVEGYKTVSFEICEQLSFAAPDHVIVPAGSGANYCGVEKGFREFKACGLIDRVPTLSLAQAKGCGPIAEAFARGSDTVTPVANPDTIAFAIANADPPSGNWALKRMRENGGAGVGVPDDQILQAQALLASDGIFVQPAACVPVAAVKSLRAEGRVREQDTVVCILTGGGLKFVSAIARHKIPSYTCPLDRLAEFCTQPR